MPRPGAAPGRADAPPARASAPPPAHDPRAAIGQALRARRFSEAAALAAGWEQYALRTYGPDSMELVYVIEAQAQIAYESGELVRAAERWITAAQGRLTWQSADHPDAVNAVNNAHHVWQRVDDVAAALRIGPQLVALRLAVPDATGGALRAVRRRLEQLSRGKYSNAG
ncbi:hypothetical protein AQ490_08195 [Wenjunlia vitaminophila]|uniref:Uncharacterized protein n=1 Tax=Wenjunlia vitaminophila TaxID=76728 RepID=A0A0T6LNG2_WENVI|nr:hypothetical protein [Wenjunlia vitaminophila]KRV47425.1 hypothetical protein AQ490_08195 [Wenjunlia vitaminophila]